MRLCVLRLVALLTLSTAVSAQNADVASERVSMDNQMLNMLDGKAALGSASVWPQSAYTLSKQSVDSNNAFGEYVRSYYGVTLLSSSQQVPATVGGERGGRFRGIELADGVARLQGDAALMVRPGIYSESSASSSFFLLRPSIRVMGSLNEHFGYFLDLSNGVRLSGSSSQIARTDLTLSRTTRFVREDSAFFDRYVGYVQYQSDIMRIRFGREALQFGFSPIDNFVHSIDAPMLDGVLIDIPYKSVRFTMTHNSASDIDTAGLAVPGKYIATHRLAVDPTDWLSLAVSDMIVYWGRGLDFSYLNPLAFFVSAGLGTQERNNNDNSMLGFDVAIRPFQGAMLYGSIIADDLNYGSIGDTSIVGNNNKFAYQLGACYALGNPGSVGRTMITAELARIDPFTFSHRSINASYTSLGAPIGYAMQSNSDRISVQLRHWFTARTYVRLDVDYTRHGENLLDSTGAIVLGEDPRFPGSGLLAPIGNVGGNIARGDGDFLSGNTFLRGNVSYQRRLRLWFSAEWLPNVFTDLRVGYTNRNGGNTPENFFFGALELRVGY